MYEYRATVTSVYDGDTITVDVDLGFGVVLTKQKIRMFGINAPEIRSKDLERKRRGYRARDWLRSAILDKEVVIRTHKDKKGKYGRWLAEVVLSGPNGNRTEVNTTMVALGLAVVAKY